MAKFKGKKVRRIEIEKVKNGDGKQKPSHLHKVTVHYHERPAQEGRGMRHAISKYEPPEETFHTSHAKAKKHVHDKMQAMTATPEEQPVMESQGGVSAAGAARNDADDVGVSG